MTSVQTNAQSSDMIASSVLTETKSLGLTSSISKGSVTLNSGQVTSSKEKESVSSLSNTPSETNSSTGGHSSSSSENVRKKRKTAPVLGKNIQGSVVKYDFGKGVTSSGSSSTNSGSNSKASDSDLHTESNELLKNGVAGIMEMSRVAQVVTENNDGVYSSFLKDVQTTRQNTRRSSTRRVAAENAYSKIKSQDSSPTDNENSLADILEISNINYGANNNSTSQSSNISRVSSSTSSSMVLPLASNATCDSCHHYSKKCVKIAINVHHQNDPFYSQFALNPSFKQLRGESNVLGTTTSENGIASAGAHWVSIKSSTSSIPTQYVVLCHVCSSRFLYHRYLCDQCYHVPKKQELQVKDCVKCFDGIINRH